MERWLNAVITNDPAYLAEATKLIEGKEPRP
jgi:hypothetical protein